MKRTTMTMKALPLAASLSLALPLSGPAETVTLGSGGKKWQVTNATGADLGSSQDVCLAADRPSTCPAGVTPYGYTPPGGWTATVPGATWMWAEKVAPGATSTITGKTTPAGNAEFTFTGIFYVCGDPESGTIAVAADDSAEVLLNGKSVASSASNSTLNSVTIARGDIAKGQNNIEIKARNGPNPSDCRSGKYSCNPAGVLFGAAFKDALEEWPKCPGGKDVGTMEPVACPDGSTGSRTRICGCFGNNAFWLGPFGKCTPDPASMPPPATCTSNLTGEPVAVGGSETRNCETPRVGTQSRTCEASGRFGDWLGICQLPFVGIGEKCGSPEATAQCPRGTSCGPRPLSMAGADRLITRDTYCDPDDPLPVVRVGEKCGSRTEGATAQCRGGSTCRQSAQVDAYCDPNTSPPLPLGASCSASAECASGRCDAGFNTAGTNICTPRAGGGLTRDPCSNNNQCRSGTCSNLRYESGRWIPGECG